MLLALSWPTALIWVAVIVVGSPIAIMLVGVLVALALPAARRELFPGGRRAGSAAVAALVQQVNQGIAGVAGTQQEAADSLAEIKTGLGDLAERVMELERMMKAVE